MGSTKAAVLPDPVWARPRTSLPFERGRNGPFLDGGGFGKSGRGNRFENLGAQSELCKWHVVAITDLANCCEVALDKTRRSRNALRK